MERKRESEREEERGMTADEEEEEEVKTPQPEIGSVNHCGSVLHVGGDRVSSSNGEAEIPWPPSSSPGDTNLEQAEWSWERAAARRWSHGETLCSLHSSPLLPVTSDRKGFSSL